MTTITRAASFMAVSSGHVQIICGRHGRHAAGGWAAAKRPAPAPPPLPPPPMLDKRPYQVLGEVRFAGMTSEWPFRLHNAGSIAGAVDQAFDEGIDVIHVDTAVGICIGIEIMTVWILRFVVLATEDRCYERVNVVEVDIGVAV